MVKRRKIGPESATIIWSPGCDELLSFWFGSDLETPEVVEARNARWFMVDEAFDAEIRSRFEALPDLARDDALPGPVDAARSDLARVIAMDQLPRNLHRGSALAFAYDGHARRVAEDAIAAGRDRDLHPLEASFLYLPFEHAEDLAAQRRSVALFAGLLGASPREGESRFRDNLDYAERHLACIERFGRFPARNRALGRASTPEEEAYLAEHPAGF